MTLSKSIINTLKEGKNLLAFSHQNDSTALFYILEEQKINFDLAMVDYGVREESKEEVEAAKVLCAQYEKKFFLKSAETIESNFEANARKLRYDFFKNIIEKNGYTNLLTAHQLNDRLEWFFMQFGKGAGICELKGMDEITIEDGFKTIRPLLSYSKEEILSYLGKNQIQYFSDSTNKNEKYKRNFIRNNFSNDFLKEYKEGVKKSFDYIKNDCEYILKDFAYREIEECFILEEKESLVSIKEIELVLKKMGYILSKPQKDEILKTKECVISGAYAVSFANGKIYINPFVTVTMDKKFKEECRVLKIPQKLRGYIFSQELDPKNFT